MNELSTPVPAEQLELLQHALGVDQYGRGQQRRNHFVTGEKSSDIPHCIQLVESGLMTRTPGNAITGGDDLFRVTRAGIEYVSLHSPAPPKLTRSQKRYRAFLDADSGLTFAQWLGIQRKAYRHG